MLKSKEVSQPRLKRRGYVWMDCENKTECRINIKLLELGLTTATNPGQEAALRIYYTKNCVFVTMANPRALFEKATIAIIPSLEPGTTSG